MSVNTLIYITVLSSWARWRHKSPGSPLLYRLFRRRSKKTSKLRVTGLMTAYDNHYCDIIMTAMASQITSLTIVYSTVYSGAGQRKHQSSTSLAFVRGIHLWPAKFPHKGPVTRKMCRFDDVIMYPCYTKTLMLPGIKLHWHASIEYKGKLIGWPLQLNLVSIELRLYLR